MIEVMDILRCSKCGNQKTINQFTRTRKVRPSSRGYASWCKPCVSAAVQRHAARNPEDPDVRRQRHHSYYERNREHVLNRTKKYQKIEAVKNRDKERRRIWRSKNLVQAKARDALYAAQHRARIASGSITRISGEDLELKWVYWAGLCWICRELAVEWDHVKPLTAGGSHCLANLRPACRSCNAKKQNKWPFNTKRR